MTDRELLELAAKAAGYVIEINYYGMYRHGLFNTEKCVPPALWNPLTDDGDALRLAVKLNLHLGLESSVANAWQGGMNHWQTEPHNGDPMAATRRAIVRAAAQIGRAMP